MADFKTQTVIEARASITFGEVELRALAAIIEYGVDDFMTHLRKYNSNTRRIEEVGIAALFSTLHQPVTAALKDVDAARKWMREKPEKPRVRVVADNLRKAT